MDEVSDSPNPSLNDILGPWLEERGFKGFIPPKQATSLLEQGILFSNEDGDIISTDDGKMYVKKHDSTNIKILEPADPDLFRKLDQWISQK